MNFLQRCIRRLSPSIYMAGQNVHTLMFKQGQWRSIRKNLSVRDDGNWVPWYTYPATEYLSQFDWSDSVIFEYGAGASSLYWAERARRVISVERDADWVRRLQQQVIPNQNLLLRTSRKEYVDAIEETGAKFDLIIIDGHWRHECVSASMARLDARGIVLLDNSDKFPLAAKLLREGGFFQIDFHGFGPINYYAWTTSVFVRGDAGPRHRTDPRPIAGLDIVIGPENED
jgi:hypothetical protein